MYRSQSKGFTLIEILIVIAIIGILASVIIPRFSVVRAKAVDSNIKTNMSILTEVAELHEDDTGSYTGFCTMAETIRSLEDAARRSANDPTAYECNDSPAAWAVAVALTVPNLISGTSGEDYWCVETRTSPRVADTIATLTGGGYACD